MKNNAERKQRHSFSAPEFRANEYRVVDPLVADRKASERRASEYVIQERPKFHVIEGFAARSNTPTPQFRSQSPGALYEVAKRALDLFVACTMLVLLLPLMAVIYIAIKCISPGDAFLRQRRLTRNNKEFTIYKFRTMRPDAEKESGAVMASENDPRIFPLGLFLRKTRLDELPQLVNVIRGDMSLVGPRPERPEIARTLQKEIVGFHRRTNVKAGLTGLAQVESGYSSCVASYRRKVALDILYVRHQSFMLDCILLFRTVAVVLFCRGAR